MITINTELKPCPFCGQEPETDIHYVSRGGGDLTLEFLVRCGCGVRRGYQKDMNYEPFDEYISMMNQAIELWNERV